MVYEAWTARANQIEMWKYPVEKVLAPSSKTLYPSAIGLNII